MLRDSAGRAEAGERGRVADQREGARSDRIIGRRHVVRQRVGAAEGQRPVDRVAHANVSLRIVPLAGAARIGVRRLPRVRAGRSEIVVGQRPRPVVEHAGVRVDARFEDADQRPPVGQDVLFHLEAHDAGAQAVVSEHRAGAVVALGKAIIDLVGARVAVGAVVEMRHIDVQRAVERDAIGADRAVARRRIQPVPQARPAVRLGGRRRRLRRRQIGRLGHRGEADGHKDNAKSLHREGPQNSPRARFLQSWSPDDGEISSAIRRPLKSRAVGKAVNQDLRSRRGWGRQEICTIVRAITAQGEVMTKLWQSCNSGKSLFVAD